MSFEMAAHEYALGRCAPAGRAVDVSFAAVPESARAARSAVVDVLTGHVDGRVLADAELLVSDLVSNSVRHAGLDAGDLVRVGLMVSDGVVQLEVENPGSTGTIAAHEPDLERGGGFGLRLVEALAHAWGVSRDGHIRLRVDLICWPATRGIQA